jgi:hypothetical protein
MPSIDEVYGSEELLKAGDLPEFNVHYPVQIESVSAKNFDDGGKLEIRFVGKKKGLICNKTNARTIADMHGSDFSRWPGRQIAIYRTYTDFQGRQVECIRVTPAAASQQFAAPQQAPQQQFAAPPQQAAPQQFAAPQNGGGVSPDF